MESGGHPLTVDDKLVSGSPDVSLGNLVMLGGLEPDWSLDSGRFCKTSVRNHCAMGFGGHLPMVVPMTA